MVEAYVDAEGCADVFGQARFVLQLGLPVSGNLRQRHVAGAIAIGTGGEYDPSRDAGIGFAGPHVSLEAMQMRPAQHSVYD